MKSLPLRTHTHTRNKSLQAYTQKEPIKNKPKPIQPEKLEKNAILTDRVGTSTTNMKTEGSKKMCLLDTTQNNSLSRQRIGRKNLGRINFSSETKKKQKYEKSKVKLQNPGVNQNTKIIACSKKMILR